MTSIRQWLVERVAAHAGVPAAEVDPDRPFLEYGISSRDAVSMAGELEELLDRPVDPTALWQQPTVRKLAEALTGEQDAAPSAVTPREAMSTGVAVIGIGCRLPGGIESATDLWQFLMASGDAVTEVPDDRWADYRVRSTAHAAAVDAASRAGGFLSDVYGFDAEFFGISPREAAEMDPQQRMLLEVAWQAFEHAGIPPDALAGERVGVFVGASTDDHGRRQLADLPAITGWTGTGSALSVLANRLSYLLDLRGPSLTVDTACSSSLVAVHMARRSLEAGECDLALVAGVNLMLSPAVTINFDRAQVMAPGGRCRPFDADADGYVRSEGCVAVVLKRLPDARADDDRVLAVVRASALNQDGRSNGLMAPNPIAQRDLLDEVCRAAGLDPRTVWYVEAHGTGTPLGDPIEAGALGEALGRGRSDDRPLLIGSVKSNLGHLEAAAGITGMAKTALSLHHGWVPPTVHYRSGNPRIDFDGLRLRVVDRPTPVPAGAVAAGVSSFGFGGANAHVVLTRPTDS